MTNTARPPIQLRAMRAGSRAKEALLGPERASVIGSTSRGLFLLLPQNRVVFLSVESYAGPLTMNLEQDHPRLRATQTGMGVEVHPGHLMIPETALRVDWSGAEDWTASEPPGRILPQTQRMERLETVVRGVLEQKAEGIVPICASLLWLDLSAETASENQSFLDAALALRQALGIQDLPDALAALTPLLGLGRGLTPSGDDFIEGLVLTLARFPANFMPTDLADNLFQPLIKLCYARTTALSANLIEMAANAEADERLVQAVDGIVAGASSTEECTRDLLGYGSTSGTDALAGIVTALTYPKL